MLFFSKAGAKVLLFSDIRKFLGVFFQKKVFLGVLFPFCAWVSGFIDAFYLFESGMGIDLCGTERRVSE